MTRKDDYDVLVIGSGFGFGFGVACPRSGWVGGGSLVCANVLYRALAESFREGGYEVEVRRPRPRPTRRRTSRTPSPREWLEPF